MKKAAITRGYATTWAPDSWRAITIMARDDDTMTLTRQRIRRRDLAAHLKHWERDTSAMSIDTKRQIIDSFLSTQEEITEIISFGSWCEREAARLRRVCTDEIKVFHMGSLAGVARKEVGK